MQVKVVSVAGDVLRLKTEGKIGQADLSLEGEPIERLLGREVYSRKVLLALEQSDYCDSMGLAWMLQCHKRFREAGGRFVMHSIPPLILQVMKVLHLDRVFLLAADEQAALALVEREQPA